MKFKRLEKLSIYAISVALLFSSCKTAKNFNNFTTLDTIATLEQANSPVQDVVVWTSDSKGEVSSHWLEGNQWSSRVLFTREGLVLPARETVWLLDFEQMEVPLCDCEAWNDVELKDACPNTEDPAFIETPVLVDLKSEKKIPLLPQASALGEQGPLYTDFSIASEVTASIGPYIFIRYREETLACGAAHNSWFSGFAVLDILTEEFVDVLSESELGEIARVEKSTAFEQMKTDRLVDISGPEGLQMTSINPRLIPGLGFSFEYQFTAESSFADSDGSWSSYSRSITIPARSIPKALEPYVLLPGAMRTFYIADDSVRLGGWMPVDASVQQAAILVEAFGMR